MRLLIIAILAVALLQAAGACVVSGSTSGSFTTESVECTGTSVVWLQVEQTTPSPISAGEDLAVQGEVIRLKASFSAPVVGRFYLSVLNQSYSASVEPDGAGKSAATFYVRVPDVDSGNIEYVVDGYVDKVVCPNATYDRTLKLSSNGTIDVAGCSSLESSALLRKMQGVSERLGQAERTFYDTLQLLNGSMPEEVSKHLIASMKNFEDSKSFTRQFGYEHDSRKRCAFAKTAADWAQRYAESAYGEAGMAYSLASSAGAASSIGFYEVALFASIGLATYLLLGRKSG